MDDVKICSKCKQETPIQKMKKVRGGKKGTSRHNRIYISNTCHKCMNAKRNKERHRYCTRKHRYKSFGLSMDEYERLYELQNGGCFICGEFREKGRLYYDHDHKTGRGRKLLCQSCNSGLGYFKENIHRLSKAIVYLNDHALSSS